MTDFNYAPIASPDEEELQKLQLSPYPAIGSPGPALLTLPAAGSAASVRDTSLAAPAAKPLSASGTSELAIAPRSSSVGAEEGPLTLAPPNPRPTTRNFGPRPSAVPTKSEYAAVEPHGWRKALAIVGPALMAAGGNVRGAESMSEQLFEAPKERLEAQKQGTAKDYDTAYREALETEKEQEAERKDAAAGAGAAATIITDKGVMQWNPGTQRYDITVGSAPVKTGQTPAEQVIHDLMTGNNGQPRINPQTQKPYSYLEAFNATEKPTVPKSQEAQAFDAYIKQGMTPQQAFEKVREKPASQNEGTWSLAEDDKGRPVLFNSKTGEVKAAPPNLRPHGASHVDAATKEKVLTYWQPALDSAERFNVMARNYQDALKDHDQQAMLSLLANHLGMTMGLQKGSRLTRDIIHEAEQSRPWLQGLQAKFDKNGYLTGVVLTPQQMAQMMTLAEGRYAQDVAKSRSMAGYVGVNDEPERKLGREGAAYYLSISNGDKNKARDAARADGWQF